MYASLIRFYCQLIIFLSCILLLFNGNVFAAWSGNSSAPVIVSNQTGAQENPKIIQSSEGYIILWEDGRRTDFIDIYGQRISAAGEILWGENGKSLVKGNGTDIINKEQKNLRLVSDNGSGAIFSWSDANPQDPKEVIVRINRIDENGDLLWGQGGATLEANEYGANESLCSDGQGGAFSSFIYLKEEPYTFKRWTSLSRIDSSGAVIALYDSISGSGVTNGNQTKESLLASSGSGEAVIAWKNRDSTSLYSLMVQKLTGSDRAWSPETGVHLSIPEPDNLKKVQSYDIFPDGSGGVMAAWVDERNSNKDIFIQRVDFAGTPLWAESGAAFCDEQSDQENPSIMADGAGGGVIVWEDTRDGNSRIYSQRINSSGQILWKTNGISIGEGAGTDPEIVRTAENRFIVVWIDSEQNSIKAQKINANGEPIWPAAGVTIVDSLSELPAGYEVLYDENAKTALITWSMSGDIYIQRLSTNGTLDPDSPVVVTTDSIDPAFVGQEYNFRIEAAGGSGARITWEKVDGNLPPGISFDTQGCLSGTPATSGVYNFTLQAAAGSSVTVDFSIAVRLDTGIACLKEAALVKTDSGMLLAGVENSAAISVQKIDPAGNLSGTRITVVSLETGSIYNQLCWLNYNPKTRMTLLSYVVQVTDGKRIVCGRFLDNDGNPAGDPVNFTDESGDNFAPDIAVNTNSLSDSFGNFFMVFSNADESNLRYGRFIDETGSPVNQPFVIDGKKGTIQELAYNPDDDEFLLAFKSTTFAPDNLYFRIVQNDGNVDTDPTPPFILNVSDELRKPQVMYLSFLGKYLVVWRDRNQLDGRAKGRFIDRDGTLEESSFYLSAIDLPENTPLYQYDPIILNPGPFTLWVDARMGQENGRDIYAQMISASGPTLSGDITLVSSPGDQRFPLAVYMGGKKVMIFWNSEGKIYGSIHEFPIPISGGDINGDFIIDLKDVVAGLRIISKTQTWPVSAEADISGDGKIGFEEIIYILQSVAGLR